MDSQIGIDQHVSLVFRASRGINEFVGRCATSREAVSGLVSGVN
jgi:hypothetical protein